MCDLDLDLDRWTWPLDQIKRVSHQDNMWNMKALWLTIPKLGRMLIFFIAKLRNKHTDRQEKKCMLQIYWYDGNENYLKVALQILGRKFYKNTKTSSLYS